MDKRKLKIVHFINPDEKFMKGVTSSFNKLENVENRYYYILPLKKKLNTYVKINGFINTVSQKKVLDLISNSDFCDVIILHSLYSMPHHLLKEIHHAIKVVWFAWGYDIYSNGYPAKPLVEISGMYKPITKKIIKKEIALLKKIRHLAKNIIYQNKYSYKQFKQAVYRIDYFSGVFPIEYAMLQKNSFFRAKQVYFNYPIPFLIFYSEIKDIKPFGDNILVGSSAVNKNNHLDVFEKIKDIEKKKIIVPLSYQGTKDYVKIICKEGKRLFGNRFIPLMHMLPFSEYAALIQNCGVAIFYLEQQAGAGNILTSLWMGFKVFLSKTSINYKYLRSEDLILFTIQDDLNSVAINNKLSEQDIYHNRKIIKNLYSYNAWKYKMEKTLNIIREDL